jgi:hypothetical protein
MNKKLSDREFIRLLAKEAGFTLQDTEILWNTAKKIIFENAKKKREMTFFNFISIEYRTFHGGRVWNPYRKQFGILPTNTKAVAHFSTKLKQYYRHENKEQENERV